MDSMEANRTSAIVCFVTDSPERRAVRLATRPHRSDKEARRFDFDLTCFPFVPLSFQTKTSQFAGQSMCGWGHQKNVMQRETGHSPVGGAPQSKRAECGVRSAGGIKGGPRRTVSCRASPAGWGTTRRLATARGTLECPPLEPGIEGRAVGLPRGRLCTRKECRVEEGFPPGWVGWAHP